MWETLLDQDFTVTRESSTVYSKDPVVADDSGLSLSVSPAMHLKVTISDFTDGTGSVTLTGLDENGNSVSETINFPGNGGKLSTEEYSQLDRVQTSNLTDESTVGSILIESSESTGEPQPSFTSVTTFRGRLSRPEEFSRMRARGEVEEKKATIFSKDVTTNFQVGDKIVQGSNEYEIEEIQPRYYRRDQKIFVKLLVNELESPAE